MTTDNTDDCLLAIETTCDETAAAVIDRGLNIRSNVIASQEKLHARFGGVVPEIASREHLRCILPVIDEALKSAGVELPDLHAVAVAVQPGLVGSLLVGLTAAKTLAAVLDKPLIGVDHIAAHIFRVPHVGRQGCLSGRWFRREWRAYEFLRLPECGRHATRRRDDR